MSINNYKARLISEDDVNNLGYTFYINTGNLQIGNEDDTYDSWIFKSGFPYWGLSPVVDINYRVLVIHRKDNPMLSDVDSSSFFIRPVINLKKSAIESECPTH